MAMNIRWLGLALAGLMGSMSQVNAQFGIVNKVRGQVRRTECLNNLRQIGQLIEDYRSGHKGQMPKSLKEVVNGGSRALLVCPQDRTPPSKSGIKCSYLYVGPLGAKTPSGTIIVYDRKPLNHGRVGRTCLFYDGSVKALSESDFLKLYGKQKRARQKKK